MMSLYDTIGKNYYYLPILLFIIIPIISVIFIIKYFFGINFSRNLADSVKLQNENMSVYFKRNLTHVIGDIKNKIISFKLKYRLYSLSSLEEKRRDRILTRYFLPKTQNKKTYKQYNAECILYYFLFIAVAIISLIILNNFIHLKLFRLITIIFFILLGFYIIVFGVRFRIIQYVIDTENYKLEEGFGDFFLAQYRILLENRQKPLERGLKVFKETCYNPDMLQFTNIALFLIRTTSEEIALEELIDMYMDVRSLNKLLIIEQQMIRGSSIEGNEEVAETDLLGMRDNILKQKENAIYEDCRKKEERASIIIWAVMFIVIQVSIFALAYVVQHSGIFKG